VSDHDPEEVHWGISARAGHGAGRGDGVKVNVIDAPGYATSWAT
jgi:hypothetical protein